MLEVKVNGDLVLLNPFMITAIKQHGKRSTLIYTSGDPVPWNVQESFEMVYERLAAAYDKTTGG